MTSLRALLFITVSPIGLANGTSLPNNGADFGPDTSGTTTSGIQEAITSLGTTGEIRLLTGDFLCTGQIAIPNTTGSPALKIVGTGMFNTYVHYTGSTAQDFVKTTATANPDGNMNTWLEVSDVTFLYGANNQNYIMNLTQLQGAIFTNVLWASSLDVFPPTAPLGQIGLKISPYNGNLISFYDCWWQNLAVGVECAADHMKFYGCYFAGCGVYNSGSGNVFNANTYSGNLYSAGPAIFINPVSTHQTLINVEMYSTHWFLNGAAILDNSSGVVQGQVPQAIGGFDESSEYTFLSANNSEFTMFDVQRNGANSASTISSVGVISGTYPSHLLQIELWQGSLNILNAPSSAIRIPATSEISLGTSGNLHGDGGNNIYLEGAGNSVFIRPTPGSNDSELIVGTSGMTQNTPSGTPALVVSEYGIVTTYGETTTAGTGVPVILSAAANVSLNTSSTPVVSFVPESGTGEMFTIRWILSCKTGSTPTLQVTFTDPNAGAQTITLYGTAMTANSVQQGTYSLIATSAAPVAVTGLDGTALGDIFATATIEIVQ